MSAAAVVVQENGDGTASSSSRESDRQELLSRLLEAVKRCQVRFGGRRSELATEGDEVSELCASLEVVLAHGLKVTSSPHYCHPSFSSSTGPSFWPFVKSFLNKQELDRYYLLKNVTTDIGRGRAWLRAAINEHTLERYVRIMVSKETNSEKYYESWSFLADEERNSMLPSIAAGVGSIFFAINIDKSELNMAALQSNSDSKAKKKKRKVPGQLVSFDDDDEVRVEPLNSSFDLSGGGGERSSRPGSRKSLERQILISQTEGKSCRKASSSSEQQCPNIDYEPVNLSGERIVDDSEDDSADVYSRRGRQQQKSNQQQQHLSDRLTPLRDGSGMGALIPVNFTSNLDHDVQSEDSMSVRSYGEESDYASAAGQSPSYKGGGGKASSSVQNSTISREDLKQALLSVMQRKDELQESCNVMKKLLGQESEAVVALKEELGETRRKAKEGTDKLELRVQTIARENDLLKHQLKKYVGAVQKLRDGPQAYETLAQLEGKSEENSSRFVDYHYEASEYEKKLIQVAEMHGELIEFNEHLQRVVQTKDLIIHRMKEELVDLRGPLPHEDGEEDAISLVSGGGGDNDSLSGSRAALLHIWIPSVFLSGSGSKTHHVYQVYLRIKDEEWNIYRRYSDFYGLHRELKQQEALVGTFDFPPKKTMGNKAEKVVEDRRKRLQAYLRRIVNLMVQTNPSLSAKPNKESVLLLMPFFAEKTSTAAATPTGQQQRSSSRSQSRSIFNRRRVTVASSPQQLAL